MAYDLNSKTVSGRDWSCGAAPGEENASAESLVQALERIDAVVNANWRKLMAGLKLGAVSDLERQNFSNFLRAWRGYMKKVQTSRTQRKQVQADLSKWTAETNAWTVKLNRSLGTAKAALKQPISTKPPEVLAVEIKKTETAVEAAPATDDNKNSMIMIGLGAGALALGLMLGGK